MYYLFTGKPRSVVLMIPLMLMQAIAGLPGRSHFVDAYGPAAPSASASTHPSSKTFHSSTAWRPTTHRTSPDVTFKASTAAQYTEAPALTLAQQQHQLQVGTPLSYHALLPNPAPHRNCLLRGRGLSDVDQPQYQDLGSRSTRNYAEVSRGLEDPGHPGQGSSLIGYSVGPYGSSHSSADNVASPMSQSDLTVAPFAAAAASPPVEVLHWGVPGGYPLDAAVGHPTAAPPFAPVYSAEYAQDGPLYGTPLIPQS
ncbi:hypothetical protein Vretimale_15596, partial [Volvox reticuliferus]